MFLSSPSSMKWMAVSAALLLSRSAGAQGHVGTQGSGLDAQPAHPRSLTEGRDRHRVEILEATTNWSTVARLPRFDPAFGILKRIEVTLAARITGDASVESLDALPSDPSLHFGCTVTLMRPRQGNLVELTPRLVFEDHLQAFDGIMDFAGTSGVSHLGVMVPEMERSATAAASDLPLFTGQAGAPGKIDLQVSAVGTSHADGGGNLVTQFRHAASAAVTVCYVFDLDCNGNGVPDADDLALGSSEDWNHDEVPDECEPSFSRFCFGDGSDNGGPACICGNSTPDNTGGCLNSTGVGGRLDGAGKPSVSQDSFHLLGSEIPPGMPTIYLQGKSMMKAGLGATFGEGLLCLGGAVTRFGIQISSESGGQVIFPADGGFSISEKLGIQPGETWNYQIWYRSPGGPCELSFNTTNGVHVVWGL